MPQKDDGLMTFGGHLEVLRRMLFRIIAVTCCTAIAVFCCKEALFSALLAPCKGDFVTYRKVAELCRMAGLDVDVSQSTIRLINTELTSQFMIHLSTSFYVALLLVSPYVLVELLRFVTPALYDSERRYSAAVSISVYVLFMVGVAISYFVLFPFTLQFLGTYQVAESVENQINISSYISTFIVLSLLMGLVFQLPVLSFFLALLGILTATFMRQYRRHAIVVILIAAAVITPSADIFTLMLVAMPIYALYELSIFIVSKANSH